MAKSDLRIDILGTAITISADEDPEYLDMLLEKYRRTVEHVQRISGISDPLKTAVLTGFLLCDDLQKAEKNTAEAKCADEAEALTLGMISRLDEMVSGETEEKPGEPPDKAERPRLFKLQNQVKNYAWGSPEWIPSLLKQKNLSRVPWAEYWMGVNPGGPSRIVPGFPGSGPGEAAPGEAGLLLSELIRGDPENLLGTETWKTHNTLPFLFKILAAAKPLSIQAHPNREEAARGFELENRNGIPLDAPNRNYRDSNHKPEIICALSPFAALCGFREEREAGFLLEIFSQGAGEAGEGALRDGLESLIGALKREDENPLKAFLSALFALDDEFRRALAPYIKTSLPTLERDFPEYKNEWGLCSYLAGLYPGDTAVLAPLYLNIVELEPGEALYLPAGILHAYVHGLGLELMADSDNVLRGGLSNKHSDPDELKRILNFVPYKPEVLKTPAQDSPWFSFPVPAAEFKLSVMRGSGGAVAYPETGPSIVLITRGSAVMTGGGTRNEEIRLEAGESFFIPAGENRRLEFSGTFTAYAASPGTVPDQKDEVSRDFDPLNEISCENNQIPF